MTEEKEMNTDEEQDALTPEEAAALEHEEMSIQEKVQRLGDARRGNAPKKPFPAVLASARLKRNRWEGRQADVALFAEQKRLEEHVEEHYAGQDLQEILNDFIGMAVSTLRDINYRKKSIQLLDPQDIVAHDTKFEYRTYAVHYVDATAHLVVLIARKIRLTPELVQWEITFLERVLRWLDRHHPNGVGVDWRDLIDEELRRRKAGEDTCEEPPKPRGKPGSKPRIEIPAVVTQWKEQEALRRKVHEEYLANAFNKEQEQLAQQLAADTIEGGPPPAAGECSWL